ncbi:GNAT family N-acetyltransferase [Leifsonia soli]|uniref:RimJ/RimL family protein N-acetyltransferase n=1 Tax=Leifsonia soli TaxID=582665 RepID=A0A852T235_9MICO|nr:GNAT family protein [Leifsonia soli]NYD74670.1 RimJ/RimL family protein N-acetyltransferase [Leifsonia soli]
MIVSLRPLDPYGPDREALVSFLTGNDFPFHVVTRPDRAAVLAAIDAGAYGDDDHEAFWLEGPGGERIGTVRLEDLSDPTPLVDLRIDGRARGRGLGTLALRATTDHVFGTRADVDRLEGQTREDNVAMRRVFLRCGWVKEAHYREAWPVAGGRPVASVAYAILRHDWREGTTTPVPWDDEPRRR